MGEFVTELVIDGTKATQGTRDYESAKTRHIEVMRRALGKNDRSIDDQTIRES